MMMILGYSFFGHVACGSLAPLPGIGPQQLCNPSEDPVHACLSVAQPCLTLCDPLDYNPPGSSIHGIFQARMLKWVGISFSRDLSNPGV